MHFGNWLRREIDERLMTQKEFARRAGISQPNLSSLCKSAAPWPKGITIVRIARVLGISRNEIESKLATAKLAAQDIGEPAAA